ncbi:MAG: hypothetical protein KI785_10100 [Devosiaceae bacterium]|nr:hypothetical protein [Devosiaceae bacterium MH13]
MVRRALALFILFVAALVAPTPSALADTRFFGVGVIPCTEFLALSVEDDTEEVVAIGNWVEGYMTGINAAEMIAERGAFDMDGMGQDLLFIETLQLACRDFPGERLAAVVARLIYSFPRLEAQ